MTQYKTVNNKKVRPQLKLVNYFPYKLSTLAERTSDLLARRYTKDNGITQSQWRVLFCLSTYHESSVTALADLARMDKSRIGRAVEKLISRSLVQSTVDPDDKRAQILTLTGKGENLYNEVSVSATDINERFVHCMNEEELQVFERVLIKLDGVVTQLEYDYEDS